MNVEQQIIEEGKKLIEVYGFRKFTMDELAQNIRISKRTIYLHFKSKDQLISSIIDSIIADDIKEVEKTVYEKENYVEKLRAVFYLYHIKMLRKKHLNELREYLPNEWEKFKMLSENRRAYVGQIYNEGVEKGVFINDLPKVSNLHATIEAKDTPELLIFILTSIIDQAFETQLIEYEFDVNTMLMYSFELIISVFITKNNISQ